MKSRIFKVWIAFVLVLSLCAVSMKFNVYAEEVIGTEDENKDNMEMLDIPDLYGIVDTEAPVVIGIELSKTEVEAPGTVEVIADLYDDISGVSGATIYFRDVENNKTILCSVSKEYYDNGYIEYEDGKWHGELKIDQYHPNGKYVIDFVNIDDKAGNLKTYYTDRESVGGLSLLPEESWNVGFEVKNENIVDTEAPVVIGIELSKKEIEAPGTVEVIADLYDEISGVSGATIYFRDVENNKTILCSVSKEYYDNGYIEYEDGKWHGELKIDQYHPNGKYVIDFVNIDDKAGNLKTYYTDRESVGGLSLLPEESWNVGFEVKNKNIVDTEAPVVIGIELSKTGIEAPGTIEVIADLYDDMSGVSGATIYFRDVENNKTILCSVSKEYYDNGYIEYEDGKWHGELKIDQYHPSGKYVIDFVNIDDKAGNLKTYYTDRESVGGLSLLPEDLWNLGFAVFNDDMGAVVTSGTTNPNLVEDIKNASEDAIIAIDYTQNSNLNKDVFDAIAGTDKKIALLSEGVQWEFNGKDIVNEIKEIDLKVSVSPLPQVNTQTGSEIKEIVNEQSSVVLHFPENGVLPGKAKIRVKADYSLRKYLGEESLCVYYYDNTNKVFVPIATDLKITSDYYIEFEIEHCSDYVITKGEVADLGGASQGSEKEPDNGAVSNGGTEVDNGTVSNDEAEQDDEEDSADAENAVRASLSPKTGDETPLGVYLLLLTVSVGCMSFVCYRRKEGNHIQ